MVGLSQSEDKQMLRQAQIAKYVNLLYEDVFQDWTRKNEKSNDGGCAPCVRAGALSQRKNATWRDNAGSVRPTSATG